jgi:hypothetical protein
VRSQLRRAALRVVAEVIAFCRRVWAGRRAFGAADIAWLRSSIHALPPLPAAGSDAEAIWLAYRQRFREDILTKDPRRFLRWPVVRPMYRRDAPYLSRWLAYLRAHPEWPSRWRPVVRESAVGDPRPFFAYLPSSGNLVHQAYQLCRFEDVTGLCLPQVELVVEFGGGYGALCRLAWALGFRGTYAIYDFPEFSALQQFYLRAHGLPVVTGPRLAPDRPRVVTLSTLVELDALLERRLPGPAAFVALWSLSETPPALRGEVMMRMTAFDVFCFGYQRTFGEMDNTAWFGALRRRLGADIDWHDVPVQQHHASSRHLFGVRR